MSSNNSDVNLWTYWNVLRAPSTGKSELMNVAFLSPRAKVHLCKKKNTLVEMANVKQSLLWN